MKIEIAANSLTSALIAHRAGADRIELCANLELGGTTPSPGTLMVAREKLDIPLHVLLRPGAPDFVYSATQIAEMKHTPRFCTGLEIEGVRDGIVAPEGGAAAATLRKSMGA